MRYGLLLLPFLVLGGCTTATELALTASEIAKGNPLISNGSFSRGQNWLLARDTGFYLARNSQLTSLNSANSEALTNVIHFAISQNFSLPQVGMMPESYGQALARAAALEADFLVFPTIAVWDSRVGGKRDSGNQSEAGLNVTKGGTFGLDKAQVQLMIVHAGTGTVFDIINLKAQAGYLTTYNSSPESILLPQLQSLFGNLVAKAG